MRRLSQALLYVFHTESLLALAALALLISLVDRLEYLPIELGALPALAARALWSGYFYLVLRKTASGRQRLPRLADYRDTWHALIVPLLQGAIVGVWAWGPLLWCAHRVMGLGNFVERAQLRPLELFTHPALCSYALLVFTLLYLPAGLVAAASTPAVWRLLDPSFGLRKLSAVQQPYFSAYLGLMPLALAEFAAYTLASLLEQAMPIPLATPVFGYLLHGTVKLAQARLLGLFAWEQAPQLAEHEVG